MPAGTQGIRRVSGSHHNADDVSGPVSDREPRKETATATAEVKSVAAPDEVPDFLSGPGEFVTITFYSCPPGGGPRKKGSYL